MSKKITLQKLSKEELLGAFFIARRQPKWGERQTGVVIGSSSGIISGVEKQNENSFKVKLSFNYDGSKHNPPPTEEEATMLFEPTQKVWFCQIDTNNDKSVFFGNQFYTIELLRAGNKEKWLVKPKNYHRE